MSHNPDNFHFGWCDLRVKGSHEGDSNRHQITFSDYILFSYPLGSLVQTNSSKVTKPWASAWGCFWFSVYLRVSSHDSWGLMVSASQSRTSPIYVYSSSPVFCVTSVVRSGSRWSKHLKDIDSLNISDHTVSYSSYGSGWLFCCMDLGYRSPCVVKPCCYPWSTRQAVLTCRAPPSPHWYLLLAIEP